jgi:hypothetical protein
MIDLVHSCGTPVVSRSALPTATDPPHNHQYIIAGIYEVKWPEVERDVAQPLPQPIADSLATLADALQTGTSELTRV